MKNKPSLLIFFLLSLSITLFQCNCSSKKNQAGKIDTSHTDISFYRFDKDFQQDDTAQIKSRMLELQKKYTGFYSIYIYDLMRFGNKKDSSNMVYANVKSFMLYNEMRLLYSLTQKAFPNTEVQNDEIRKAYTYSKLCAPKLKLPKKVVYCVSGLNVGAFTVDTEFVGIGLDMYLNNDTLYNQIFPNYIASKLRREMICQNVMKAVYNNQYGDPYTCSGALIDCIIQVGKQQYFLSQVLPHIAEEYQFAYSQEQLKWCNDNEKNIWKYLADHDLYYSESEAELRHFIGEQANTQGMPAESPGNIGAWLGFRIVSAYMNEMGSQVTLDNLFSTEPKTILAKSKYKP